MAKQVYRNEYAISLIAAKLKALRNNAGLLQKAVAEDTGLNIGRIEASMYNITITTLARLCRYYGVTLTEFFEDMEL